MNLRTRASIVIVIWVFCIGLPRAGGAQYGKQGSDNISIGSDPVFNPQFVEFLNYGFSVDLNHSPPVSSTEPWLSLHGVPRIGNCLPGSHYSCSNHYYLAVDSGQLGIAPVVYDLGEVGEISDIEWLRPNQPETARLRIRVTNFPREYFEFADLPRIERVYELEASLNRLTVIDCQSLLMDTCRPGF